MKLPTHNQAVWFSGPRRVELRPADAPPPAAGQVRVITQYSAISHGSEMLVYRGQVDPAMPLDLPTLTGGYGFPISFGYACVGRVYDCGPDVSERAPGDLVFCLHPHQHAFTIGAGLTIPLPPGVDPLHAVLAANLETALNIVHDGHPRLGEAAVVFGQGVVGLLVGMLLRRAGITRLAVVDPLVQRRGLARKLGADLALEPGPDLATLLRDGDGRAPDLAVEVSGAPAALQAAIECVALEGTVVAASWYGSKPVSLDLGGHFHRGRVRLRSSQVGRLTPETSARWNHARRWRSVGAWLQALPVNRIISHRLPSDRAAEAYRLIDNDPGDAVQVVLEWA
ncbi:MAG: zinc-binding alcohol dehydrogenase [Oscillochloris sp.]|nr:zinc-binding alcohol dehydrogenase [Oscillochloris sp.]